MSKVSAKVTGTKEIVAALTEMNAETAAAVKKVNDAIGLELRNNIIKRYNSGPASGKVYKKYNPNRTHQASAPGQAPMSDTGALASYVLYKVVDDSSVVVFSNSVYGPALEFGNESGSIKRRPAWLPAAEEIAPKYRRLLQTAIDRFMP